MAIDTERRAAERRPTATMIVDCDVHPTVPGEVQGLLPFLTRGWQERLKPHHTLPSRAGYEFPAGTTVLRMDAKPPSGGPPGSDPAYVVEDLLDRCGTTRAVLISLQANNLRALPNPDDAAALATAFNDYIAAHWLTVDQRFRHAMVVAPQDPQAAAKEIDRYGETRGVVAVHLPLMDILMGNRHYYPIYAAAQEHGLPILVHPSGSEGGSIVGAPNVAGGRPGSFFERYCSLPQIYQSNVISLVSDGVFERFPKLKVLVVEAGYGWVPHVMARMDKAWLGLRKEVPWVKRPPSEYVLEHVRFTSQPIEEPKQREHVVHVLAMMEAERTLLFASDYPHWDNDMPDYAMRAVPEALRQRILYENARELFGARLD
jgi:predicted TIM-barrel fold metal-dependent hydrolase